MIDELAIPDFLDRKTNGVTPDRLPTPRRARRRQQNDDAGKVRIYLPNRIRGASCGFHEVKPVHVGRKHVSIKFAGKDRCIRIPRAFWDRIKQA